MKRVVNEVIRWQIAGSATWQVEDGALLFFGDRVLRFDDCPEGLLECLPLLERGATQEELKEVWQEEELLKKYLIILQRLRFLVQATDTEWVGTIVERQVFWMGAAGLEPNGAQKKLTKCHVALLGLGGLGSVVLQHLVSAGIQTFTLIDHDIVQLNNLNRQLIYKPRDVGRTKVSAAREWLNDYTLNSTVYAYAEPIYDVQHLIKIKGAEQWDCLLVAADHPVDRIRDIADSFCELAQVPVLSGGCGFKVGAWGPLLRPYEVPQWRIYRNAWRDKGGFLPEPARGVMKASFSPVNAIVAGFIAYDLILYLAGLNTPSVGSTLTIDFESQQIGRYPITNASATDTND
jgi:hypothetical protein